MTDDSKPLVAVHVCCGPCATSVVERLRESYRVHAVWYNPNIQPDEEHDRRLATMHELAGAINLPMTELHYDVEAWLRDCAGLMDEPEGGRRCGVCFEHRLWVAGAFAAEMGADFFATTLTVSPHKPAATINPIGLRIATEAGVDFVDQDFKKRDGFARSIQLSREFGLYRQRYCGCLPSRGDV